MAHSSAAAERARRLCAHLDLDAATLARAAAAGPLQLRAEPSAAASMIDQSQLRHNGWGYNDTSFVLTDAGDIALGGSRYALSGTVFPGARAFFERFGLDTEHRCPAQKKLPSPAPSIINEKFLNDIRAHCSKILTDDSSRIFHSHGATCQEVYMLRHGRVGRVVDLVVYPDSHENVEAIVAAAVKHNVVIIPYGGGTTVTAALQCPEEETRSIVSLDMHNMCRIKWLDKDSMMACIEAGAVGFPLDRALRQLGVTLGHEPDSAEFSTLGGWVATRASGMKKNLYGNIEDIVLQVKMVTPTGTIFKTQDGPRVSLGVDVNQIALGSEGCFGVVTEVTVRVRELPQAQEYGSFIFPNFHHGVAFMREIARKRWQPASLRLMDNVQFLFGQALKPLSHSFSEKIIDSVKRMYVLRYKGFDPDHMVAVTAMFEGTTEEVKRQKKNLASLLSPLGGMDAGGANGERGYFLTFMIAYLRDYAFEFGFVSESFETSMSWSNVIALTENVKECIRRSCAEKGVKYDPFVSARVTQVYDSGACVYFYFGFIYNGLKDPVKTFSEIEDEARDEVIRCGGSLSHHHGIGKLRKKWTPETISPAGVAALRGIKSRLDPQNIFAVNNTLDYANKEGKLL